MTRLAIRTIVAVAAVALAAAACTTSSTEGGEIVLLTHDSFAVSDEVLAAFEADTGIEVSVLTAGDAGAMVNQAILTADNPIADVLFGVDNTFLSRAVEAGIFTPYRSSGLDRVDPGFHVAGDPVTPIDYGDVCINYDIDGLAAAGLEPPADIDDLTDAKYRGTLVVENPATSSPGLAFLMATIASLGEDGWEPYWEALLDNDTTVASGWEEAYYGEFSGGAGEGTHPLVVSYASSPPAEVLFGELEEAPTAVMTAGCFRQIEYAGILSGGDNEEAAQQLIDFMLSVEFQEDIPLNMFVFPVNRDAMLPDVFVEHAVIPDAPITLDPDVIEANREAWIERWTELAR
jgi:thiamine transport system substrate-binding protein